MKRKRNSDKLDRDTGTPVQSKRKKTTMEPIQVDQPEDKMKSSAVKRTTSRVQQKSAQKVQMTGGKRSQGKHGNTEIPRTCQDKRKTET